MNTIAALLLVFSSPSRPLVPHEALPEVVEVHQPPAPDPAWTARALATWGGPSIVRPNLYDYRYITW